MTTTIIVSNETLDLIRKAAILPFQEPTQRADGGWLIEISDFARDGLTRMAVDGETLDMTLTRILRAHHNIKPN